jgi:hypothetical protein
LPNIEDLVEAPKQDRHSFESYKVNFCIPD